MGSAPKFSTVANDPEMGCERGGFNERTSMIV